MPQEPLISRFFMMVFGNAFYVNVSIINQLRERLHLSEVLSEDMSDVVIAFVVITSRAGTDIQAALQKITPSSRPVVLVVLHHTFDPCFIAPDSRLCVNRSDIFTVDCLFHEDRGLLKCQRNSDAVKAVTDHLISEGALRKSLDNFLQPRNLPCGKSLHPRIRAGIIGLILGMVFGLFTGLVGGLGGLLLGGFIGGVTGFIIHVCLYQREQRISSLTEPLV